MVIDHFSKPIFPKEPIVICFWVAYFTKCYKQRNGIITARSLIEVHVMDREFSAILHNAAFDALIAKKCPDAFLKSVVELGAVWLKGYAAFPLWISFAF